LRHALDELGTIHVIEDLNFLDKLDEDKISPTYLVHTGEQIDSLKYRYGTPPRLEVFRRDVFADSRLFRQHFLRHDGGSESHYVWEGDRLQKVISLGWRQRFSASSQTWAELNVNSRKESRFEYDDLGRLQRIVDCSLNEDGTVIEGLPERVVYERPNKKDTISSLSRDIQQILIEQIPATATQAKSKGPFYCLLVCYSEEDFTAEWPPFLVLGADSERRQTLDAGRNVVELWSPDELRNQSSNIELRFDNEQLVNYCRLHGQLMDEKEDYKSAKKILRQACKALNVLDWNSHLRVTDDFVVAAVDNTGEINPVKDLKASIPSARYRELKQRQLV
jgi:hypothetical protein